MHSFCPEHKNSHKTHNKTKCTNETDAHTFHSGLWATETRTINDGRASMIRHTEVEVCTQTFVDVPHNSRVVDRPGHHEVSIPCPADVIHVFYVSPEHRSNKKTKYICEENEGQARKTRVRLYKQSRPSYSEKWNGLDFIDFTRKVIASKKDLKKLILDLFMLQMRLQLLH